MKNDRISAKDASPHANPVAGEVKALSQRQLAIAAVYGPLVPMTQAEIAAFESAKAKVKAADEARRQPAPQLNLERAA